MRGGVDGPTLTLISTVHGVRLGGDGSKYHPSFSSIRMGGDGSKYHSSFSSIRLGGDGSKYHPSFSSFLADMMSG